MDILKESKLLYDEMLENRRFLHKIPEIGFELQETTDFVLNKLKQYGYKPTEICQSGIVAIAGNPKKGKTILLRADMDALPMKEETDLDFKSINGNAHACGHDIHITMLLAAAKIIKKYEKNLNGCVKFMFQPDEEGNSPAGVGGADVMIEKGVLENPKVDVAFSMHYFSGKRPSKTVVYRRGPLMSSCDNFKIEVQGTGAHGSQPEKGVSPIIIGSNIVLGIQNLVAYELASTDQGTVTIGKFNSGTSENIIPDTANISGTIRMSLEQSRSNVKKRIKEISENIAKAYGGEAKVSYSHGIPTVYNNIQLTEDVINYNKCFEDLKFEELEFPESGSDDFSSISHKVPSCYIFLCGGDKTEGYNYSHHNPHIIFNEKILPYGTAMFVKTAFKYLETN